MPLFGKIFLIIMALVVLGFPRPSSAQVRNPPALLAIDGYDPRAEPSRGLNYFTASLGMATFGNLFLRPSVESLTTEFKSKLETPEMLRYFPSAPERERLSRRIAERTHRNHLTGPLTNESTLAATRSGAQELVSTIIRRALEVEGVRSAENRNEWATRILAPFQTCMNRSRVITEGQRCLLALERSAVPNVGLAIAYELNLQEFGDRIAATRAREYRQCLRPNMEGAQSRLKSCVVAGVRRSALEKARELFLAVAKQQAPQAADAIVNAQIPQLEQCLNRASERNQFAACADLFTIEGGSALSQAVVQSHPDLVRILPRETERRKIADDAAATFRSCMQENRRSNRRSPENGTLETTNCADQVKTAAIRSGGLALFQKSINEQIRERPQQIRILLESQRALDSCWKPKESVDANGPCLRSNIASLVRRVADHQLNSELPPALLTGPNAAKGNLLNELSSCLEKEIPRDVVGSPRTEASINACASSLIRRTAGVVAEHGIRNALAPHGLPGGRTDDIIREVVNRGLLSCLGTFPSRQVLSRCSLETKRRAAEVIGETLLRQEWSKFVREKGGLDAIAVGSEEEGRIIGSALTPLKECLKQKVTNEGTADREIDQCIKESVIPFGLNLARLETARALRQSGVSEADSSTHQKKVAEGLRACLAEQLDRRFTLESFLSHIDRCKERIASQALRDIGTSQISMAIDLSLPPSEASLASTRDQIRGALLQKLENCAQNRMSDRDRESCLQELQNDAFLQLVPEAGSYQARKNLRQNPLPKEITDQANDFRKCMEKKEKSPDQCGRDYTLALAKKVAHLKIKRTMEDLLGRSDLSRFTTDIQRLEDRFTKCLGDIAGSKMDEPFLKAVEGCSKSLEQEGLLFAQARLREWMNAQPPSGESEQRLREQMALAIPCLEPILPAVEFDPNRGLPAEGILKVVSNMVGDYLAYDSERAKEDVGALMEILVNDLNSSGPARARSGLLESLARSGGLDQLLKSMVRAEVRKIFNGLPRQDQIPAPLLNTLLSRETLDSTLTPEVLAQFRPLLLEKILKPMLLDGKAFENTEISVAVSTLQKELGLTLIQSPVFGNTLVRGVIQNNVRTQTSGFLGSLGAYWYGMQTTNWEQARNNPQGQRAEAFMKDQILRPMVTGETLPAAEQTRRRRALETMVLEALQAR